MTMKQLPVLQDHYNTNVWVNLTTESMRREECLCLNCAKMKPGEPDHCSKASKLYQIAIEENLAMCVTRCPTWEVKQFS